MTKQRLRTTLTTFLAVRALFGVLCGSLLAAGTQMHWANIFERFGNYMLVDGTFAVVLAIGVLITSPSAGSRMQRWLAPALGTCDSVVRLGAGFAILGWPGIPDFPVTSVVFLETIGALTVWVSLIELGVLVNIERRHDLGVDGAVSPRLVLVAAAGLPMLLLGAKLLIAPPASVRDLRLLFSGYAIATSCGIAIAAIRSQVESRRQLQRPALSLVSTPRRAALRAR